MAGFPLGYSNFDAGTNAFRVGTVRGSSQFGSTNAFLFSFDFSNINIFNGGGGKFDFSLNEVSIFATNGEMGMKPSGFIGGLDISVATKNGKVAAFGKELTFMGASPSDSNILSFNEKVNLMDHGEVSAVTQGNIIKHIASLWGTTESVDPAQWPSIYATLKQNPHLYERNFGVSPEPTSPDTSLNYAKLFWAYYTNGFINDDNRLWIGISDHGDDDFDHTFTDPIDGHTTTSSSTYTAIDLSSTIFNNDVSYNSIDTPFFGWNGDLSYNYHPPEYWWDLSAAALNDVSGLKITSPGS